MLSQNLAVWSLENHSNSNNNWSPSPIRVNVQFLQLCLRSSIGNTISKTKTKLMKEIWPQGESADRHDTGGISTPFLHFFLGLLLWPFEGETQSKNFTGQADYGTSGMVWNLLGVASPAWGSSDRYIMPPQTWTNNIVEGLMRIGPALIWKFIWTWLCKLGELQNVVLFGSISPLKWSCGASFFPHVQRHFSPSGEKLD